MSEMKKTELISVTGKILDAFEWTPEGRPTGIVQLVHGMAEHIERYDRVGKALSEAGYIVVGHTHLGHGEKAEIPGHFGDREGWQYLIDDVHQLRRQTQAKYSGLPYVILGHSMGSFVVRCYLMQYAEGLAGAVLSGTGYYGKPLVMAGLLLANMECLLGKTRKPSPLINQIGFASSNKPFEPARTPFDWLSRAEEEVDRYVADPYCGHLFTASGYRELFRGLNRLTRTENLKKIPGDLPVLFFSGSMDPVGAMGKGVEKVAGEFRNAGVRDVQMKLYPDGRHEMFNEINHGEVIGDLIAWLKNKIG